jgi:hypothetical protein
MVRTFLKVYMELGFYFLFQEQIKDIIIMEGGQKTPDPAKRQKSSERSPSEVAPRRIQSWRAAKKHQSSIY